MQQASFHCPQCNQVRLFQSQPMNHVAHILASVFLCGIWLPIWGLMALSYKPSWHCAFCGYYDQERFLREPGLRQYEVNAAAEAGRQRQYELETREGATVGERIVYFISDNKTALIVGGILAGVVGVAVFAAVSTERRAVEREQQRIEELRRAAAMTPKPTRTPLPTPALRKK